jgi:hypothetical protein
MPRLFGWPPVVRAFGSKRRCFWGLRRRGMVARPATQSLRAYAYRRASAAGRRWAAGGHKGLPYIVMVLVSAWRGGGLDRQLLPHELASGRRRQIPGVSRPPMKRQSGAVRCVAPGR